MEEGRIMTAQAARNLLDAVAIGKDQAVSGESLEMLRKLDNRWQGILMLLPLSEGEMQEGPSKRNFVCFQNAIMQIIKGNLYESWWEIRDMLDFRKDTEYLSPTEMMLLAMAIHIFRFTVETKQKGR